MSKNTTMNTLTVPRIWYTMLRPANSNRSPKYENGSRIAR
jgi:hypothetical protein